MGSHFKTWTCRAGLIALIAGALPLVANVGAAHAAGSCSVATITWDGGSGSTDWGTAANWNPNRLPTTTDQVCIPAGAPQASVDLETVVKVKSIEADKPLTIGNSLNVTSTTQSSSFTNATISGTLTGAGARTLAGTTTWTGTISGAGPVTIPNGASVTVDNYCAQLDGTTVTNNATVTFDNPAYYACVQFSNGATLNNAGTVNFADSLYGTLIQSGSGAGSGTIHNTGTIENTGPNTFGTNIDPNVGVDNDGTITNADPNSILTLSGTGTSTGIYTALTGATMSVGDTTVDGATITGAGTVSLDGTITATGAGLSVTTGHAAIAGTLTGTGARSLGGTTMWTGTISGSGPVTIPNGASVTVTNYCAELDGATVTNNGTLTFDNPDYYGCVTFSNGATLNNAGTVNFADSLYGDNIQSGSGVGSGTIHNTGTIENTGTNTYGTNIDSNVGVDNDGTITNTDPNSTFTFSGTGTSTGTYTAVAGAALSLGDTTVDGAAITGAGTVSLGGTITATGAGLSVTTGHAAITGTLTGTGPRTLGGTTTWTGTITGTGPVTIPTGASVTVDNYCAQLDGATVTNNGTLTFANPDYYGCVNFSDGATLNNAGTVNFADSLYGDDIQSGTGPGSGTIHNTGTIESTGTNTYGVNIDPDVGVDNDGTIDAADPNATFTIGNTLNYSAAHNELARGTWAASGGATLSLSDVDVHKLSATVLLDNGSLNGSLTNLTNVTPNGALTMRNGSSLTTPGPVTNAGAVTIGASSNLTTTGAYTQTAGSTTLESATATLTATGSIVDIQGGTLAGKGTAGPSVSNKGTVSPGLSPGILTVSGTYGQTASGHLAIQIGGATAGTGYDQLAVTGSGALAGTIDLSTINGFTPALGQTYNVATFGSRTGTFANITGRSAGSGRQYAVSYTATKAIVTVVAGPAGPDLVVGTAPVNTPFATGAPGQIAVTVTNAGGSATSGTITAAVTLGTGLTYASAAGSGWSCSGSGTSASCTRTVALASGASAPAITVMVNVAAGAVPSTTASTTVSGGGDTSAANNTGATTINAVNLVQPVAVFTPASPQSVLTGSTVNFDGSASTGTINQYLWDFGDGSSGSGSVVSHQYTSPGVYTAVLRVTNDAQVASASVRITVLDSVAVVANAGDDRVVGSGTSVAFTGDASTPIPGIESFSWFFSDTSTTVPGRDVNHTFTNNTSSPETFEATLTATRASQNFTDTVEVTVMPASGVGLAITVTDGSSGLAGAAVTVIDPHGVRYDATTNGSGVGTIYGLPTGSYTAYAYADGYQPATQTVTVTNGTGSATMALTTGAVGSTVLESKRLTYDEIVAAGIDPSDPANQNVVHFTICLAFDGAVCNVTVDGDSNSEGTIYNGGVSGGGVGGGGCTSQACDFTLPDGRSVEGTITMVGGEPVMNFLLISGEARWLKEFFEVKMLVVNLAPAGFTFTGGAATLTIPDGLSLAPTAAPQDPTIDLADIPGGGQAEATWIVRGDLQGEYNLEADYTAVLDPVGRSVLLVGKTANPLKVWGRGALQMIVDADDVAVANEPYRVRIGLQNVTSGPEATPVYNPAVQLYPVSGSNFIYQPREQLTQGTSVIAPGDTFFTDYFVLIPQISGTLNVAGSFVFLDGNPDDPVPPATIESHPRQTALSITGSALPGAAQLSWAAVPSATDYEIFTTPDPTTAFGDTPAAIVAAGTTTATIPAPADVPTYYAVSATVGGKAVMRHALVGVTALAAPIVSIGDATVVEGDGGKATASFPVRLSAPSTLPVSVTYATSDGTAQSAAPADYAKADNKVLTIAAGKTGGSIKITVDGDRRIEPDENFTVTLSNPVNGVLGRTTGTGTILNDDPAATPKVSIGDVTVVEGDIGTQTAIFDLTLDQASASTVTIPWSTAPGTATAPSDYTTASGTASFPPGTTSKTISVVVKGDTAVEPTETATVNLGAPTGAVVADSSGTLTILDDDTTPSATAVSIGDVALSEGSTATHNATFTVRLAQAAAGPVSVQYATSAGTATATADYTTKVGTLTLPAGTLAGSVKIPIVADGLAEGTETFSVTLSNPTGGATLGRAVGTGTIIDDDPPTAIVGIGQAASVEGNSGNLAVPVAITLSQPSATPVSVVVNSVNGTANGSDFTAVVNKTVTIAAGATSATVPVTIKGDATTEPDQTFTLGLSSPTGATIGRATGTFTILNDD